MVGMTLDELFRKARSGDPESAIALANQLVGVLREFFSGRFDSETSLDLGQRVLCDVYKGLPTFEQRHDQAFERWVLKIARTAALDELRKRQREAAALRRLGAQPQLPQTGVSSLVMRKQLSEILAGELTQLDGYQRRSLEQHLAERDPDSIAAQEGIARGTVRSRLSRAKQALARRLGVRTKTPSQPRRAKAEKNPGTPRTPTR